MDIKPLENHNVFDLGSLNDLRQQAIGAKSGQESDEALKKAAQQFEAIFTQMLLKSMRQANEAFEDKESPLNSDSVKFFEEMHDQQLATELSSKGSLGLADLIVQQLSPNAPGYKPASVIRSDAELQTDKLLGKLKPKAPLVQPAQTAAVSLPKQDDNPKSESVFDSPKSFVEQVWDYAKAAAQKIGLDPEVMVAQAALETGWGKHVIKHPDGKSSNNLFNIKADRSWDGANAQKQTLEFEKGLPVKKQASFRAYESIKDSIDDFVNFLQANPRYEKALEKTSDSMSFLNELQRAGYATDPNYANKIKHVLERTDFKSMLGSIVSRGVN
ncbi:Flagellar protein FlgJ [peptidoglycan hydrolase] [Pseudoalteromonas luteoviolacea B = ATCC 29581]|nr:Flagellar protein FlgJ [peptidoglycan hydrolase] [Pseudoalteromonas luteoviolacea B = ATCC 29581]